MPRGDSLIQSKDRLASELVQFRSRLRLEHLHGSRAGHVFDFFSRRQARILPRHSITGLRLLPHSDPLHLILQFVVYGGYFGVVALLFLVFFCIEKVSFRRAQT